MGNNKSNNKLVILLTIIIICLVIGGGFVLYKVLSDTPNSNLGGTSNNNQPLSGEENNNQLKNYDLDNINNVIIEFADPNVNDDLVYKIATITNKEEINRLLLNLDDAQKIGDMPSEIGFEGNVSITVYYNGDPSTHIIILDNGDLSINYAVGAGETGYARYSIANKKLSTELIDKYNDVAKNKNSLENYNLDSIKNVIVEVPVVNAQDPVMKKVTITNKEEINRLLLNVDAAKKIGSSPSEVGYEGNVTITVNYNGDPSVHIIIWDSGDISINYAVGAGETDYALYSITNKKLATELINRYND